MSRRTVESRWREQEAIRELASEIVRQTGFARNPNQEAAEQRQRAFIEGGREHWKAQIDFLKHMATVSGASIVAVVLVNGTFTLTSFQAGALGVGGFGFAASAGIALVGLLIASRRLVRFSWGDVPPEEEASEELTDHFSKVRLGIYVFFALGLSALGAAVVVVPFTTASGG